MKIASRLLAAIPPLMCAIFEKNLSKIVQYASIPALWIAFIAPVCLQYFSRRTCERFGTSPETPYSIAILSGPIGMIIILCFAVVCYVLMIGTLFDKNFVS